MIFFYLEEAPTITLLSPDEGETFNASIQSEIEFSVEIDEDVGIKSAEIFFEGPSSSSFVLDNTIGTDIFTETINILLWSTGSYSWYALVIDRDENTHTQKSETRNTD